MSETGGKLGAAYSALPREEPSPALDAAILAASRRALAKPSLSRRFAGPVSIAAVLVLAFGVTIHMQQEKSPVESPDMYGAPPASPAPEPTPSAPAAERFAEATSAKPAEAAIAPPARKNVVPKEKKQDAQASSAAQAPAESNLAVAPQAKLQSAPAPKVAEVERDSQLRDEARASGERKDLAAAAEAPLRKEAAAVAQAPAAAPAPMSRLKREANAAAPPAAVAADAAVAMDEPTRELEAIAKLRAERRHEEADKALAEFRRKRPDYRIPDAMWERVKPR